MKQPLKLKEALRIIDQKTTHGDPVPFDVTFFTNANKLSDFKRITLRNATRCGLPRAHQHVKDLIGIKPLEMHIHPYSVNIRLIAELNGQPIIP